MKLFGDLLLDFHENVASLVFDFFGEVVIQFDGWRSWLDRVSEDSHAFEAGLFDEVFEFFELFLSLSREAGDEGGSEDEVRDGGAEFFDESCCSFSVDASLHSFEDSAADVLKRHVEVREDLAGLGDRSNQLVGEVDRVQVHEADPLDAVDLFELAEEFGEHDLAVEVHAVIGGVLSDDDQFLDAVSCQFFGFLDDHFHWLGDVLATHLGDGAEGAGSVAAFGDFEVGVVLWGHAAAGSVVHRLDGSGTEERALFALIADHAISDLDDFVSSEDADDVVDIGNLFEKLRAHALSQTARNDDSFGFAGCFQIEHFLNDRLRFRSAAFDEAAGVDDHEVGFGWVGDEGVAVEGEVPEHLLAVDQVFRAAQRYEGVFPTREIPGCDAGGSVGNDWQFHKTISRRLDDALASRKSALTEVENGRRSCHKPRSEANIWPALSESLILSIAYQNAKNVLSGVRQNADSRSGQIY